MSSVKVAVILPSRGLMFSQTAEEILLNVKNIPHKFFFSHKQTIPECFEKPTQRALEDPSITHMWFVEDDMILPSNALELLLEQDVALTTVNYPTTKKGDNALVKIKGEVIYGGTGCTLVKREVFEELKPPYFRTDIAWTPKNCGEYVKLVGSKRGNDDAYGLHDVNFFLACKRKGIPAHDGGFLVGQRKLLSLGKAGSNDGAHKIETWIRVKGGDYWDTVKKWPVQLQGVLQEVLTPTGSVLVSPTHAKTLVDKGLAQIPPQKAYVIDDSEVL